MINKYDIEDIIFGMADIITENKALHKLVNELQLECEKYKAYFYGDSKKAKILSDISMNNASVDASRAAGWLTNQEYIEDWQTELERRMTEEIDAND